MLGIGKDREGREKWTEFKTPPETSQNVCLGSLFSDANTDQRKGEGENVNTACFTQVLQMALLMKGRSQ